MDTRADRDCFKIDAERSTLTFTLRHTLLGEIRGEFRCWGGWALIDRADPARSSTRIWVDLSSIDTGSEKRNDFILGTELFDVRWEPGLVFDSERLELGAPGHAVVIGCLTLHSYCREVEVSVDAVAPHGEGPMEPRLVATAHASINRGAFGLRRRRSVSDWLSDQVVGETIDITAHVEAVRAMRPDAGPEAAEMSLS